MTQHTAFYGLRQAIWHPVKNVRIQLLMLVLFGAIFYILIEKYILLLHKVYRINCSTGAFMPS